MTRISWSVAIVLGVILLIVGLASGYFIGISRGSTTTSLSSTECAISGEGAILIRVISDGNGQSIPGAKLNGTLRNQCGNYTIDNFTQEGGGAWFSPVLPTTAAGVFGVSVQYSGKIYSYSALISPLMVTCVTARLPSGNFTSPAYQIGNGAVCPAS